FHQGNQPKQTTLRPRLGEALFRTTNKNTQDQKTTKHKVSAFASKVTQNLVVREIIGTISNMIRQQNAGYSNWPERKRCAACGGAT
ncbi:MAG: hypothetical protein ACK5M4_14540, partial [Pseudorhodobacter sp.]